MILVSGIVFLTWGQEHPPEVVALKIAPLPELIDVWDAAKVRARRPLLIAHRYDMVELDVMASLDHHPVVFHDKNMMRACGMDSYGAPTSRLLVRESR